MILKEENGVLGQEDVCHCGTVHQKSLLSWSGFNPFLAVSSCAMIRPQDADVLHVQSARTQTVVLLTLGTNCAHGCCLGVISCSRREVAENCTLLDYYAGSSGNFLLTFRDNLAVPSSWLLRSE